MCLSRREFLVFNSTETVVLNHAHMARLGGLSNTIWPFWFIGLFWLILFPTIAPAQDTPDFFRQNCMNCHTIGGGDLTGPDLKDVTKRKDREWLVKFMMNPKGIIDSGDPYATQLFKRFKKVPMPTVNDMTKERCKNLLDLIEKESKLEKSEFFGLQISNEPFTDTDQNLGRDLFFGITRLENGGAACLSCHSVHDLDAPPLGGGRLGPDLTQVYGRLEGRKALSAWLVAPGTVTMKPIFKDHSLTSDEIHALVAYFAASADKTETQPTTSRVAFLLMSLVCATALVFAMDAIWKRRFHAVREPLVKKQPKQDRDN